MYRHKGSNSKEEFLLKKQRTFIKKTLYDSSQERMSSKNNQMFHADKEIPGISHDTNENNDEVIDSKMTPTLKSVVQLVQRESPKGDFSDSLADTQERHAMKESDGQSKPEESSSVTPEKRCLGEEGLEDTESTGVKTKKKKHKRHDVVSSTSISVKVTSSSSVVTEKETRTTKHKKLKKSKSREEFFRSLVEAKDNADSPNFKDDYKERAIKKLNPKHRRESSPREHKDRKQDRNDVDNDHKKPIVLSKVVKVASQHATDSLSPSNITGKYSVTHDNTSPSMTAGKHMPVWKTKVLKLISQNPPTLPPPLQESDTSEDEEDWNNNEHADQPKERTDSRSAASHRSKSGSTRPRSSSASSISSTLSTASSVSSSASFTYQKSTSRKKTKKTSKTMVTYKTAKHLHKSRRSKDGTCSGGDSSNAEKESSKLHKMSNSDRPHEKENPSKSRKGPDTAVILSHIRKAFASSCTDSSLENSPIKPIKQAISSDRQMKSLATKIKQCANNLTNMAEVAGDKRVKDVKPVPLYESDAESSSTKHPCTEHIYGMPTDRDMPTINTDASEIEESASMAKMSPKASQPVDFHNTTYQLSEKEPSLPSSVSSFDDAKKVVSEQDNIPLPKQMIGDSPKSSQKDEEASTSKPVTDYKKLVGTVVDYGMESGELSSDDTEDESWKEMVSKITKEEDNDAHWNYVVDSERQRVCVKGTTYANPPIPWRTNYWHWQDKAMQPNSSQPPFMPPSLPHLPRPPTILRPPAPRPSASQSSTNTLYHQASQRMWNPTSATSPFVSQNRWFTPPIASAWRPKPDQDENWRMKTLQGPYRPQGAYRPDVDEDTNWRIKRREPEEDDIDSYDSCCSNDDEYYEMPKTPVTSYPKQQSYTGYNQRNLPPRLARLQQEKQQAYTEYHSPSSQTLSSGYPTSNQWASSGPSTSLAATPRQSWPPARKSFSPGTPSFEYDTSGIMFPYSMRDYIDTHCHIDFLYQRLNYKGTFQKFSLLHHFPPNYAGCVAVFCTPHSVAQYGIWNDLLKEEKIWGAFGIHPHHAKYYDGRIEENILHCMKHSKAIAYGEIGLDYSSRNDSDWILQQEVFRRQLGLALKMEKPLVIHSRDAEDDTIDIMTSMVPKDYKIHRHCFTGTPEEAERWLAAFPNSFIGLTALVTFPSAVGTHRTAAELPLDRLLLETDAPYFLPRQCPKTIKYANPSMAVFVAERIARLRGITTDEVLIAVRKNTKKMYGV